MSIRRTAPVAIATAFALLFFGLGNFLGARQTADNDSQLAALRAEIAQLKRRTTDTAGTAGRTIPATVPMAADDATRAVDRGRREAAAAGRDGPAARQPDSRSQPELRRAVLLRRPRLEQLRHRRLSRRRLLHHRQARRHRAQSGRAVRPAQDHLGQVDVQGPAALGARRRLRRCAASKWIRATGRSSRSKSASISSRSNVEPRLRLRLRRADLPPRQRLLEGHHRLDRLRRPAHVEQARDLPDRRPSWRVRRRRAEPRRRARRHPDRPDAGGLSVLVHPAAAPRDVPQSGAPQQQPAAVSLLCCAELLR